MSWYKGWKSVEERGKVSQWQPNGKNKKQTAKNQDLEIAAVLFVPRTANSELAVAVRTEEAKIASQCHYKIKIVERAGTKLKDLLIASDPFLNQDCWRKNCLFCGTKAITLK